MDWLLQLPFAAQLAILFVLGLIIGSQINRAAYRLNSEPKHYDPWTPPLPEAPPRAWSDYLPVVGWLGLRREAELHGEYFWVRPMLVELCTGTFLACLWAWEMNNGLLASVVVATVDNAVLRSPDHLTALQLQFLSHSVLFVLLMVASLIDFDEKLIPDEITTPGTLIGLFLFAACLPASLLPDTPPDTDGRFEVRSLLLSDPLPERDSSLRLKDNGEIALDPKGAPGPSWPALLDGPIGLAAGISLYVIWWIAVVDLVIRPARGLATGARLFFASIFRQRGLAWRLGLLISGLVGVVIVWTLGHPGWPGLMSSLFGMMLGGGIIFMFRIVGGYFLSQEAMGYGDVTLMAMVGAFLGWQPTLIAIFLAPLFAVGFSVGQAILTGKQDIYFGPFLSLAAMFVVTAWGVLWLDWGRPWFLGVLEFWQYSLALVIAFPLVMGILLMITRSIRQRFWPDDYDDEDLAVNRSSSRGAGQAASLAAAQEGYTPWWNSGQRCQLHPLRLPRSLQPPRRR